MKIKNFILAGIILFVFPIVLNAQSSYISGLNNLKNPVIDTENIYDVKDIVLIRDVATISLDSGTVYFFKPINGRTKLAVFEGKGTYNYQPPIEIEIRQLKRMMKKELIMDSFNKLVLFFDDSTFFDIAPYSTKTKNDKESLSVLKDFIDYEIYKDNDFFDANVGNILFSNSPSEAFYSFISTEKNGDLFFTVDPTEYEEISFYKGTWDPVEGKMRESINQFFSMQHNQNLKKKETNDIISFESYKIHTKINSDLSMACHLTAGIKALTDNVQWFPVNLSKQFNISNLSLSNGEKLEYYSSGNSNLTWIKLPDNTSKNETLTLVFDYSGSIIDRIYNLANFDLTFDYPDNYKLVSIGALEKETKDDDRIISHWKTNYKVRNASFNLGPYDVDDYKPNDSISVDMLYITTDKHENVGNDLMLSLDFFTKLYGPLPFSKLNATELPAGHGEAFPGLLHLSNYAFERGSDDGFWEMFVSHEVSHQWWGITVDFESYRDQWLSEGFAEYSSLMYLQTILQENDKFLGHLVKFRKELLETRKSFISDGIDPGPISLGYRNNTNATKNDYQLIIYKKGAWIFHMIRNIFLNLNTMNEDAFIGMLREVYSEYKLKRISTKQFREKVAKFSGLDFGWFFDQWVDNYYIPKYTFSTKSEKSPDGNYKIKCRVKQENVPPSFKMIVPIKITLSGDRIIRLRTLITGAASEFDLPILAENPEEITFNDLESVLCEVEYSKWE